MKTFSKFLAASALTLSVAAVSAPASAATIYLDFAESNSGATLNWTRDADTIGGDLAGSGQVMLTIFDNVLTDGPLSILANFTLTGRDDTVASLNTQSQFQQWEIAGAFSFTAVAGFVYDGNAYLAGENLLTASFSGADFVGAGNRGNFSAQRGVGGAVVNYSSGILSQAAQYEMDTFNFEVTQVTPNFAASSCDTQFEGVLLCDDSLVSLGGNTRGTFSAAVPEPGTWALMILGFGGAGAMIRARRREVAVA